MLGNTYGCDISLYTSKVELERIVLYDTTQAPILVFQGPHRFLSNFYPASIAFCDIEWPSVETAYQAMKSLDPAVWVTFSGMTSVQAKKAGRRIVPMRPDWEDVKVGIMCELVWIKFSTIPSLQEQLLATNMAKIEEGNSHRDRIWGVCPPGSGLGQNLLGKILMTIRRRIRLMHLSN